MSDIRELAGSHKHWRLQWQDSTLMKLGGDDEKTSNISGTLITHTITTIITTTAVALCGFFQLESLLC